MTVFAILTLFCALLAAVGTTAMIASKETDPCERYLIALLAALCGVFATATVVLILRIGA